MINCNNKIPFYDIDPPEVIFYCFINDNFLIQFNEPIESLELILNQKTLFLKNLFPKANIFLTTNIFEKYTKNDLIIKPKDTSGNLSNIELTNIVNNPAPAFLSIKEIRLKYTKKLNQMITFNVEKEGNLAGFKLIIFFNNKREILTFEKSYVNKNENLTLNFLYNKEVENKNIINFSKSRNIQVTLNKHISQTNSLILITDYNNMLMDYILYYDSNKKSLDKLKNSKNFKTYLDTLNKYNVEQISYFDITGNTSKKTIVKFKNNYIVKK